MPKETPQEYVNRVIKESESFLSTRKIADRAERLGYSISHAHVAAIANGTNQEGNLTVEKIKALAAGLGRPEDEVFAVFRGKQLNDEGRYQESIFAVLWNEYKELSPAEQREVKVIVNMVHHEIQRRLIKS